MNDDVNDESPANKQLDNLKDPIQWIDLIGTTFYMRGRFNGKIPVDWGRVRMEKFLENFHNLMKNNKTITITYNNETDSHADVLNQVITKLVKAKFAPEQEIMEEWKTLLQVELNKTN
jgi:hypothetical protein